MDIVDLVDIGATGKPIIHFESEEELSGYTKSTRKFFPRDNVESGGLLKFLLRRIFVPNTASRQQRNQAEKVGHVIYIYICFISSHRQKCVPRRAAGSFHPHERTLIPATGVC